MESLSPRTRQIDVGQGGAADHTDGSQCEPEGVKARGAHIDYFASGSGRTWNLTTELRMPRPPSMCHVAFGP